MCKFYFNKYKSVNKIVIFKILYCCGEGGGVEPPIKTRVILCITLDIIV
jgi:hypothetical protein